VAFERREGLRRLDTFTNPLPLSTFVVADLAVPRIPGGENVRQDRMAVALVLALGGCFGAQAFRVGGNAGRRKFSLSGCLASGR
jgi:hypothetical protein